MAQGLAGSHLDADAVGLRNFLGRRDVQKRRGREHQVVARAYRRPAPAARAALRENLYLVKHAKGQDTG